MRTDFLQHEELARALDRKHLQEHGVEDTEQRRIGADTQSQREDGHTGEARTTAHRAQRVVGVLQQYMDRPSAPHLPCDLLD